MIKILISLLPVFIFLLILIYLDSYKLVKITNVILVIFMGFVAAILSYFINDFLLEYLPVSVTSYARYIAPVIEEIFKASFIIYMINKKKIGFMVDAAIYGFAIGAGFALLENIYYLNIIESSNIFLWIIRGFGTAVMHGGTMAIFSILTKNLFDRSSKVKFKYYLPGLLVAILIHSFFNHLLLPAITITIIQLIFLPLLIIFTFHKSEKTLKDWMEIGLNNDVQILEHIDNGIFTESYAGQYLLSLQNKFSGTILADALCLIKIHSELSIKAKGVILMRKVGLPVIIEDEVKEKLNELKYLEKSIGPTGKLAIAPIFNISTKDLWQLYMLGLQ